MLLLWDVQGMSCCYYGLYKGRAVVTMGCTRDELLSLGGCTRDELLLPDVVQGMSCGY